MKRLRVSGVVCALLLALGGLLICAIQDDPISVIPFTFPGLVSGGPTLYNVAVIDAASEAVGFVFRAPRSGDIDAIGWATRTVTTGCTVDVRLETISAGLPSGTLEGTTTNGAQVVADANDNTAFLTTLTAAATVTKGDKLAVVIQNPASSYCNAQISTFFDDNPGFPFVALYTGTWAKSGASGNPVMWIHYSDAPAYSPIPGVWPIKDTLTATAISTSTTPDVLGARFTLAVGRRLRGVYVWADIDGDFNARLVSTAYHQANGTGILASASVAADDDGQTSAGVFYFEFPEAYTLVADTYYRLIIEPSTSTSLTVYDINVYDVNALAAYGSANFHLTTAKDPTADGDWTNYNSGTFRVPLIWLVFDGVDKPAASSGGSHVVIH